ncbi:MAG: nitroreductase [Flavobacteriales bacterium]|nr:nitroreductase [Flavobacteriales bacterium]
MKYNLSEVNEVIKNRRSISPEKYSGRKVHREIVENILTNATWAPNHGMTQPWRFKVFMDEGMNKLADFLPELYKSFSGDDFSVKKYEKIKNRCETLSVMVMICVEPGENPRIPEIEEIEAVACGIQNMYLTCTAYGIGGFWSSPKFVYTREMADFLNLSEKGQCLGIFYMGYPEDEWPNSHRKPLEYVSEWITE